MSRLGELFHRETEEAHAAMDRKEALLDRYGYGGQPPMTFTGTFRLHFNRHGAAPLVWCVATDYWELAVSSFTVRAPMRSVYAAKATADDDDGKPSAWLEVTGTLTVRNSHAEITR